MPGRRKTVQAAAVAEGPSEYELDIQRKRAANKVLLDKLKSDCATNGVPLPQTQLVAKKVVGKQTPRKRKAAEPVQPSRKSARISKQTVDFQAYSSDDDEPIIKRKKKNPKSQSPNETSDDRDSSDDAGGRLRGPRVNGKVFGPIEGVEVGKWWEYRDECGRAGVHPPTVAGIYGGAEEGCYSVAVSAGYPEDIDLGDTFTYTGSGGRELKTKNLRTAPQSSDQQLTRGNAALDKSAQTGNPIRVIRGFKAAMGPITGYRYDGLYKVVRSYQALNSEGKYKVYKFDFERLPGQPPVDYGAKERTLAQQAAEEAAAAAEAAANAPPTPPASGDEGKDDETKEDEEKEDALAS